MGGIHDIVSKLNCGNYLSQSPSDTRRRGKVKKIKNKKIHYIRIVSYLVSLIVPSVLLLLGSKR